MRCMRQTLRFKRVYRLVLGSPDSDEVEVNGITLTKDSPLRELRAACKFFGFSQSGSKLTCFQRIMSH